MNKPVGIDTQRERETRAAKQVVHDVASMKAAALQVAAASLVQQASNQPLIADLRLMGAKI